MATAQEAIDEFKATLARLEAGEVTPKQTAGQWFNHNWMTSILAMIAIGSGIFVLQGSPAETAKLWDKLANVSMFWGAIFLYKKFWRGTSNDQGAFVNTDPVATAIYVGVVVFGTALIIALC